MLQDITFFESQKQWYDLFVHMLLVFKENLPRWSCWINHNYIHYFTPTKFLDFI